MKIKVIQIGRTATIHREAAEHCHERIARLCDFDIVEVRQAKKLPPKKTIEREGEKILAAINENDNVIALSEEGNKLDSIGFAKLLKEEELLSHNTVFVVGGAFGLSDEVKERANLVLSLSPMTFQHDVAVLVLLEQIFRALDILRGGSYHK